jgi:hypothetical protein
MLAKRVIALEAVVADPIEIGALLAGDVVFQRFLRDFQRQVTALGLELL